MVIASKVYFNPGRLSRQAIHREIDGSLKRLGTDYLDLYIIHRFDYDTPMEETMEALNDLVRAGKVRALGASAMYGYQFYNMQLIARDHGWARFQAMENHYNLLYREDERELIPICKQMGVSLMPYSPLAAGHLTRRTWTADTLRSRTDRVAMGKYDRTEEQDLPIVARVARDEDARSRYLRTIQAKERDMEGMVDRALLAFTDNGPGVPPEQLPPSTGETPPTPSCFRRCGVWAIAWAGRQDKTENAHGVAGKARRERFVSCLV